MKPCATPILLLALMATAPGLPAQASASAATVACPPSILERPALLREEGGWLPVLRAAERPLEHAGLYAGAAEDLSALVPDTSSKTAAREVVVWRLPPEGGASHWLGCTYVGSSALLVQRLEPAVRQCSVAYALLKSGRRLRLEAITCR